jgi:hypothetical protein
VKDLMRIALGQGLGMGWGDELEAAAAAAGDETYEEALARIRAANQQYYEQNPNLAMAAEIGGGLLPTAASFFIPGPGTAAGTARAAGALSRIRQMQQARRAAATARSPLAEAGREMIVQGGLGAVAGAGAADEDRLGGAGSGAFMGGATGLATPFIPRVVKGAYERYWPSASNIERAAAGNIWRERGAMLPGVADFEAKLARDRALGIDVSSILNTSPRLARQAEMLANRGGDAAEALAERAERNIAGARGQTLATIERGLGKPNYFGREADLLNQLRSKARTAYDEAYQFGTVRDPRIVAALQTPELLAAYNEARRIAGIEKAAAQLRGEDVSRFDLEDIFVANPQGEITIQKLPDVKTLDYVKRGLDSLIDTQFGGNAINKTMAANLRTLRNDLVNAIDKATEVNGVSAYRNARRQYAGDLEVLDALRTGRSDFASLQPEQITAMASNMSQAEKDAFREGVVQGLFESINNTSQERNFAKLFANNPNLLSKLKPLFDSSAQFDLFDEAMKRQSQLFRQEAGMVRGSQTAARRSAAERFESDPYALALFELGSGASLPGMVVKALSRAQVTDDVAAQMAKMLNAGTPDEIAAVVEALERYGTSSEAAEWAAKHIGRGTSSAARNVLIENYEPIPQQTSDLDQLKQRLEELGVNAERKDESLEELMQRYQNLVQ